MARYVTLAALVAEGFASRPSELLLTAVDNDWPLGIDGAGHVGLREREADRLRQQKAEREAREARAAERQRIAAQDADVEAVVRQAREQQLKARERRLVERTGVPLWQLDAEMRRAAWMAPGTGGSLDERDRIASANYTIDDYERFVEAAFGPLDVAS